MQACIGPNLCGLVLSGAGSSLPPAPRSGLSVAGCCCCCSLRIRLSSLKRSTHCFLVFPGTLHAIESHRSDAGRLAGNSLRASSRNFCCSLLHACPPPTPLSASIFPTHLPIAHCRFLARKQGTPGVPAHLCACPHLLACGRPGGRRRCRGCLVNRRATSDSWRGLGSAHHFERTSHRLGCH